MTMTLSAQSPRTIWDGVYTEEQAGRVLEGLKGPESSAPAEASVCLLIRELLPRTS